MAALTPQPDGATGRSLRAALTFAGNAAFTAVSVSVGIVALPYFLAWLGPARLGGYRALADWFAYLPLLEFGLGGALMPLIVRSLAEADEGRTRDVAAVGVRVFAGVTVMQGLAGLAIVQAASWLIPVDPALRWDLKRAAVVLLLAQVVTPLAPFRFLMDARQRGYQLSVLLILQSLLITGIALLLAGLGWGITGQAIGAAVGSVAFAVAATALGLRRHPGILGRAVAGRLPREIWEGLRRLNGPALVRQASARIGLLSDRVIVAALLGPEEVVPLYVTARLVELAQGQLLAVGSSSWAALAELHVRGEQEVYRRRVIELTGLTSALGVAALAPVVAFNRPFVVLWVGRASYAGDLVTLVACLDAYLLALMTLWDWCFVGAGKIRALVPLGIASTAVNVAVGLALTRSLGVLSPLLGTLVALLGVNLGYLVRRLKLDFGVPGSSLLRAAGAPLLIGVPYGAVLWAVGLRLEPGHLATAAGAMTGSAALFLGLWWTLGFGPSQKAETVARVKAILGASGRPRGG